MPDTDLIHIRVGKGMKKQMQDLIESGMFSTESEIAREGIRHLIIKYMKEAGYGNFEVQKRLSLKSEKDEGLILKEKKENKKN